MKQYCKNNTNLSLTLWRLFLRKRPLNLQITQGGSHPPGTPPWRCAVLLLIASLCFSSNAPFKSAGNLTNEQRSEQRGCSYCTTHPVPSTSPCPAVVHLSSLMPFPYSKPASALLKVTQVQHTLNTCLLTHVQTTTRLKE